MGKWKGGTLLSVFDYRLIGSALHNNERDLYLELLTKTASALRHLQTAVIVRDKTSVTYGSEGFLNKGFLTRNNTTKNLPMVNIGFTFKHFNTSSYACLLFRSKVKDFNPFLSAC